MVVYKVTAGRNYESCDFQAQTLVIGLLLGQYCAYTALMAIYPSLSIRCILISANRALLESTLWNQMSPFSQMFVWMSRKQSLAKITRKAAVISSLAAG